MFVLPTLDEPVGLAAAHDGRRVGRPVALEHARAGRRRHAADAEQILVGDRHARDAAAPFLVERARSREGALRIDVQEDVQLAVERLDAVEVGLRDLLAGQLARVQQPRDLLGARRVESSVGIRRRSGGRESRPPCAPAPARAAARAATARAERPRRARSRGRAGATSAARRRGRARRSGRCGRGCPRARRERLELVRLQPDMGECGGIAHVVGRQAHGFGV